MNSNYDYDVIKTKESEDVETSINLSWTTFFRQIYVLTGVWVIYFSLGLSFGAPTVLIPQIRKEANSTDAVTPEMESWLSSIHGYSCLPFVIIIPILSEKFGRKTIFIYLCLSTVISNIVFFCSTTTMHILISEMMHGVLLGGNISFLVPICTEYSSPHYRARFLIIKEVSFYFGVWVANAVGTFFHWKHIGIIGILCCFYSLTSIFWPESPFWLALKGRYEDAATAHHWLKGHDKVSDKELENLIKSQKAYRESRKNYVSETLADKMKLIKDTTTTKDYYYPLLMTVVLMSLYHFSGKMVCMMYAIQVIHQVTNSEETAYMGMLLLEGITILSMSFGCFVSKYLKRKTLLLSTTFVAVVTLYVLALYLYLVYLGICYEKKLFSVLLLVIFTATISCGPVIAVGSILGEIISLRYKCSSLIILTLYSGFLMATLLKLAPNIFRVLSLHGAFLFYAIFASIFTIVVYIYLPETKGKSLQEIQDSFKN